ERGVSAAPSTAGTAPGTNPAAAPTATTDVALEWSILCDRVEQEGLLRVGQIMRDWVQVIELAPGRLSYTTPAEFEEDVQAELRDALLRATGERWDVSRGEGEAQPSLRQREETARAAEALRIRNHPLVQSAL